MGVLCSLQRVLPVVLVTPVSYYIARSQSIIKTRSKMQTSKEKLEIFASSTGRMH